MRFAAPVLLAFSTILGAQETAPPEVDEALRARVTEFFGYHVKGEFRKAMVMVAEETQDEYFASQKTRYESFKIDSIRYTDNFTKAVVNLTVQEKKRMGVQFPETVFTEPTSVLWKLDNGKWCFYIDHKNNWQMPFGPSDPKAVEEARKHRTDTQPPISPENIQKLAGQILGQSTISRNELTMAVNKPGAEEVIFKNGQGGPVKISLLEAKLPEGLTARLDKTEVPADGQATLKVSYAPPKGDAIPAGVTLNIVMEPFSRMFPVTVRFVRAE